MLRTYGRTTLRSAGATVFLAFVGLTAALVPLALFALLDTSGKPPGDLLYVTAAIVAGCAVGWLTRRT